MRRLAGAIALRSIAQVRPELRVRGTAPRAFAVLEHAGLLDEHLADAGDAAPNGCEAAVGGARAVLAALDLVDEARRRIPVRLSGVDPGACVRIGRRAVARGRRAA